MKRICFLTYQVFKPSTRFRVLPFARVLREKGFAPVLRVLSPRKPRRYAQLLGLGRYDVVVVQKRLLGRLPLRLLRLRADRLVYDFDDSVTLNEEAGTNGSFINTSRTRRFRAMMRAADLVTAGNAYLKRLALEEGARRVEIIPSFPAPVVPEPEGRDTEGADCVVGWMGSAGNLKYLEAIAPALIAVLKKCPGLELRVVSDGRSTVLEALGAKFKPWSEAEEEEDLAAFDIGLMPLPDNEWTRGKCGFKMLQYFSAARPVVTAPVGVNALIVRDGGNGFFATSHEEWAERIIRLVLDSELRRKMGRSGYAVLGRDFAMEQWGEVYAGLLDGL